MKLLQISAETVHSIWNKPQCWWNAMQQKPKHTISRRRETIAEFVFPFLTFLLLQGQDDHSRINCHSAEIKTFFWPRFRKKQSGNRLLFASKHIQSSWIFFQSVVIKLTLISVSSEWNCNAVFGAFRFEAVILNYAVPRTAQVASFSNYSINYIFPQISETLQRIFNGKIKCFRFCFAERWNERIKSVRTMVTRAERK